MLILQLFLQGYNRLISNTGVHSYLDYIIVNKPDNWILIKNKKEAIMQNNEHS